MQNLILLFFHTIFSMFQSFIDKRSVCVTDNKRRLLESFICLGCVTSKVSTGRRRHINQKHLFVVKTIKKGEGRCPQMKEKISKAHLFFFPCATFSRQLHSPNYDDVFFWNCIALSLSSEMPTKNVTHLAKILQTLNSQKCWPNFAYCAQAFLARNQWGRRWPCRPWHAGW